jgi:hypothetical protein
LDLAFERNNNDNVVVESSGSGNAPSFFLWTRKTPGVFQKFDELYWNLNDGCGDSSPSLSTKTLCSKLASLTRMVQ